MSRCRGSLIIRVRQRLMTEWSPSSLWTKRRLMRLSTPAVSVWRILERNSSKVWCQALRLNSGRDEEHRSLDNHSRFTPAPNAAGSSIEPRFRSERLTPPRGRGTLFFNVTGLRPRRRRWPALPAEPDAPGISSAGQGGGREGPPSARDRPGSRRSRPGPARRHNPDTPPTRRRS